MNLARCCSCVYTNILSMSLSHMYILIQTPICNCANVKYARDNSALSDAGDGDGVMINLVLMMKILCDDGWCLGY